MTRPVVDRFISKTCKASTGCVEWTARRDRDGYGRFWLEGKQQLSHRVAHELFVGPVDDSFVLHLCDNPPCVNPLHLALGDQQENQRQRRTCNCGACAKCRWRDYMRAWSQMPENAEKIRARVRRYRRETNSRERTT